MSWLTSLPLSFRTPAVLAGVLFGLSACETTGDLSVDLPDIKATSSQFLDLPVGAATVLLDPALTLKTDRFLVGRLRDQVTGLSEARAVLNLRASNALVDLPGRLTRPELDTVELLAPFEQVYGSSTAPLRYDVLPLTTKLDERAVYTAASEFTTGTQPLATNLSAPLNATRTVTQTAEGTGATVTTTVPDQLVRQVLQRPNGPANALLNSIFAKLSSSTFAQTDLDAVLPGIVLAPSAGYEGSIVGFGRSAAVGAQLRFSFTYDSIQASPLPVVRKRRSYSLFFGPSRGGSGAGASEDPRYYTQLRNDRSGTPLAALNGPADAVPAAALDGRSYLQAGLGLGTRITFGSLTQLETLRNTPGVAINRAELLVPVQPFTTGVFPYPPAFYALEVDARNQVLLRTVSGVPTERVLSSESSNPNNILVNPSSPSPNYSFVLTTYLQSYLTPKGLGVDETGAALPLPAALVLTPTLRTTTTLTLNRAVLDASNIRLRVYYSQLR